MNQDILFNNFELSGDLTLSNRIVMAPMNRSMADDNLVPTDAMADYYARRADTGLIITESLMISPSAQGYPNTPAIFTPAQVEGWKKVVRRVHEKGGKIFAQIWHTGRVSHPIYLNGEKPIAPSAVALKGRVPRTDDLQYDVPREMTEAEIRQMIQDFAQAAANAREAGFDGVEIHAANGYLLDQFLHWDTNRRTDDWGGSEENMARILFEVLDAVKQEITHVGLRVSPVGYLHLEHDDRDKAVSDYVLQRLNQYDLTYVHTGMFEDSEQEHLAGTVTQYIRSLYKGIVIACGGYDAERGRKTLHKGDADLIAIGRPLIANPDYVEKVRTRQPLTTYSVEMLNELV
ncbi:alkene reductase [Photobacterium alginatilyticum]|uniref:Alkene reductase n=1 Tax=Photobacterium alginatilyticum TaxID=1775171 RepID=A0ABW9YBV5_9GAMM|nr:alkene reductase [Photobacterium alginatilyticum]NBI51167.1 alkene reductase [Photobacterium alginatilyticum]